MFSEGDMVSVIHDVIVGKVIAVNGQKITIKDADGFTRYYRSNELAKQMLDTYNVDTVEASDFIEDKLVATERTVRSAQTESRHNNSKGRQVPLDNKTNEIDLHIEVLMPEAVHWPVAEILQKQMIACRSFVEKAVAQKMKTIILIHGKGEGVLKNEIYNYLNRVEGQLHVNVSYHDADFRTFGTGATQVNIKY